MGERLASSEKFRHGSAANLIKSDGDERGKNVPSGIGFRATGYRENNGRSRRSIDGYRLRSTNDQRRVSSPSRCAANAGGAARFGNISFLLGTPAFLTGRIRTNSDRSIDQRITSSQPDRFSTRTQRLFAPTVGSDRRRSSAMMVNNARS